MGSTRGGSWGERRRGPLIQTDITLNHCNKSCILKSTTQNETTRRSLLVDRDASRTEFEVDGCTTCGRSNVFFSLYLPSQPSNASDAVSAATKRTRSSSLRRSMRSGDWGGGTGEFATCGG